MMRSAKTRPPAAQSPEVMVLRLTPRQNEIISEALARFATDSLNRGPLLPSLREALVRELAAVTAVTDRMPSSNRSISG